MPMAKPVPMAIWPVPTPAYADGNMPTVAVGTDCADGIFSCADGYRPSAPCLRPVVMRTCRTDQTSHSHYKIMQVLEDKNKNIE
jgi:hypothetical protein